MAFDPQRRNLINAIFRYDKPCVDASDFLSDHFLRFGMFVAMNRRYVRCYHTLK